MRSANDGGSPPPSGGDGGNSYCTKGPPPGPSGDPQALVFTVQPAAPWFAELHFLCPLVTTPQRWAPSGQEAPLTLQFPFWKAAQRVAPSLMVFATALPLTFCPS